MSIYAQFDEDGDCVQIATGGGWSDFGDWADSLKAEDFPLIKEMWEKGEGLDLAGLREELAEALKQKVVAADSVEIADGILHAIDAARNAEFLLITNGMTIEED